MKETLETKEEVAGTVLSFVSSYEIKDGASFTIFARTNPFTNAGYVAGTLLPSQRICFVESLYVDDERFKGKGLSILLLTKAFWLGKFDGLVPVDTNENPGYWEAATAKNIVPIRHPITNSEMRAQIKAVLSAAEGRWRNIMAFPSNGRAIEA